MANVMEQTEALFVSFTAGLRLLLEILSVLAVVVGLGAGLSKGVRRRLRHHSHHIGRPSRGPRLTFASWLATALEFQLAADIVATTVSPTGEHLIQLAAVAVIRTFLNVFLAREIESESRHQHNGHNNGLHGGQHEAGPGADGAAALKAR